MLTYSQLARLERAARDSFVLNAYGDATELDAVSRRCWRRTLSDSITALRKSLAHAPPAERNAFDQAAARLENAAVRLRDDLDGAPGWIAFATPDGFLHSGHSDSALGTHLRWQTGIATAPYLRRADHMGDVPREGFHAGTPGTAWTDAARRALDIGREQLLRELTAAPEGRAHPAGWIVLAGSRAVAREALDHLGAAARKRAMQMDGSAGTYSPSDVARIAAAGRQSLRAGELHARVTHLIDRALAVLENGATLHEVGDKAAARLDGECEGIAATLRFAAGSHRRAPHAAVLNV